jgi:uncharacterized protein (DUF1015 family)
MPSFAPFVGLVYDPAVVGPIASVTAPPYDVIDEPARSRYLDASRYSVAHVDLAGEGKGYDAAAAELRRWRTEGALKEVGPAWFGYEMRAGSGTLVRGVICGLLLEEWGDGVIPHEMVMDGPVQDRLQLLASVRVHPSAIYATVERAEPRFTQRLEEISATPAFREAVDEEVTEYG